MKALLTVYIYAHNNFIPHEESDVISQDVETEAWKNTWILFHPIQIDRSYQEIGVSSYLPITIEQAALLLINCSYGKEPGKVDGTKAAEYIRSNPDRFWNWETTYLEDKVIQNIDKAEEFLKRQLTHAKTNT